MIEQVLERAFGGKRASSGRFFKTSFLTNRCIALSDERPHQQALLGENTWSVYVTEFVCYFQFHLSRLIPNGM